MTDSLVQTLRRQNNVHVLSGGRLDELERQFGSDQVLGMTLGASAVLRSSLTSRRDSLMLFVAVFDTRAQRYLRSFRTMAPGARRSSSPGSWFLPSRSGSAALRPSSVAIRPDSAGYLILMSAPGHLTRSKRTSMLGPSPSFRGISEPSDAMR